MTLGAMLNTHLHSHFWKTGAHCRDADFSFYGPAVSFTLCLHVSDIDLRSVWVTLDDTQLCKSLEYTITTTFEPLLFFRFSQHKLHQIQLHCYASSCCTSCTPKQTVAGKSSAANPPNLFAQFTCRLKQSGSLQVLSSHHYSSTDWASCSCKVFSWKFYIWKTFWDYF